MDVLARLQRLERELAEARETIRRLEQRQQPPHPNESPDEAALSRREWLRRAALASGAATTAALVVDAVPAAAADGDAIKAGAQTAAESSTVIYADGLSSYVHGVFHVTDTAFGVQNGTFQTSQAAVKAYAGDTKAGAYGVMGYGQLAGILGIADTSVSAGVLGVCQGADGAGVQGAGATWGVKADGGNAGVVANAFGIGGTGVDATGLKYGVFGHCDATGTAVRALITDKTNSSSALSALTAGKGAAVRAASTSGVGVNASGVRGAILSGSAAAVNLHPGTRATHPTTGATGDLYVDTAHRLWFCKGGTSWVQLT